MKAETKPGRFPGCCQEMQQPTSHFYDCAMKATPRDRTTRQCRKFHKPRDFFCISLSNHVPTDFLEFVLSNWFQFGDSLTLQDRKPFLTLDLILYSMKLLVFDFSQIFFVLIILANTTSILPLKLPKEHFCQNTDIM